MATSWNILQSPDPVLLLLQTTTVLPAPFLSYTKYFVSLSVLEMQLSQILLCHTFVSTIRSHTI